MQESKQSRGIGGGYVIVAMIIVVFVVYTCGSGSNGSGSSRKLPSTAPTVRLVCADCDDVGMDIYIYGNKELSSLSCQLGTKDNRRVKLLQETVDASGDPVSEVLADKCAGWLASSLVQK